MINPENSKEIIDEVKALTTEIYTDVATPVLGMLWGWERIEELIEERVNKNIIKILFSPSSILSLFYII